MAQHQRDDLKRHFLLDEGSLLFCDRTKRLFALNSAATCLWILFKDGARADGLQRYLVDAYGLSRAEARAYVCATIADWRELGLFNGAEPPAKIGQLPEQDVTARGGEATLAAPSEPLSRFVRWYRVLDQHWCVDFTSAETLGLVQPVLAHFESWQEPNSHYMTIAALRSANEHVVRYAGAVWARCTTRCELAPLIHALILNRSVEARQYDFAVHGAAVRTEAGVLLMPGPRGSGKTTLTAMLISDGFEYLSDDCVLLSGKKLKAKGVPGSLCIKESGVAALVQRYPELQSLARHRRGDGTIVRYLAPVLSQFEGSSGDDDEDIKFVVFPKYSAREPTSLAPLSQFEGLRLLIQSCTIPSCLEISAVEDLIAWSNAISYFAMNVSSLFQATQIIKNIVSWRAK